MTARLAKSRDGFFSGTICVCWQACGLCGEKECGGSPGAHPKREAKHQRDDIAGTGDIANRAANVISMGKTSENEGYEFDVGLSVMKTDGKGLLVRWDLTMTKSIQKAVCSKLRQQEKI